MAKKFKIFLLILFTISFQAKGLTVGARAEAGEFFDLDSSDKNPVVGLSVFCELDFINADYVDYQIGIRPEIACLIPSSPLAFKIPLVIFFSPNPSADFGCGFGPMHSFF